MFSFTRALLAAAVCGVTVIAEAQGLPAAAERSFAELRARVEHVAGGDSQRVQIQWFTETRVGTAAVSSPRQGRLLDRRRGLGALPAERDPQLSTDHLVVISTDGNGRELDWRTVSDPRLVRAELPDAQGQLHGRTFTRPQADLLVDIPDDPAIAALRVYEAQWTGTEFVLKLIVTVTLE